MSYGYDYQAYEGDDPYAAPEPTAQSDPTPGRGRRRKAAPEPEYVLDESYDPARYEPAPHEQALHEQAPYDPQWEHSGLGWDQEAWNQQGANAYAGAAETQYAGAHDDTRTRYAEPVQDFGGEFTPRREREPLPAPEPEFEPEFDSAPSITPEHTPATTSAAPPAATGPTATAPAGRGAFGAAGLAVVTGIGAIAATPVLAVVIGLSQIGLAVGWTRTVGLPYARRTVVLVIGIGLAAAALAYRLIPDHAPAAMGAALGAGFVFLAADQLFRKDTGAGWPRSEALAAAATGAAFAVLPAGYLVAQRGDSALAGACALAAAVAVLSSALVGGGTRPVGILAGAVAATAVGTLTAVSLNASAGSKGGAMGGLISGLFAVVGARTADRLAAEGSDVRISAQALPVAFSAIGAVIAAQVLR